MEGLAVAHTTAPAAFRPPRASPHGLDGERRAAVARTACRRVTKVHKGLQTMIRTAAFALVALLVGGLAAGQPGGQARRGAA